MRPGAKWLVAAYAVLLAGAGTQLYLPLVQVRAVVELDIIFTFMGENSVLTVMGSGTLACYHLAIISPHRPKTTVALHSNPGHRLQCVERVLCTNDALLASPLHTQGKHTNIYTPTHLHQGTIFNALTGSNVDMLTQNMAVYAILTGVNVGSMLM